MSVLEPTGTTTSGTVAELFDYPSTGLTGSKVLAGDSYVQRTYTSVLGRKYFKSVYMGFAAQPSALVRVIQVIDEAGEVVCSVRVSATGALQMFDHEGEAVGSALTLQLNHPYLVQLGWRQEAVGDGFLTLIVDGEVIEEDLEALLTNVKWNRTREGLNTAGVTVAGSGLSITNLGVNDDQGAAPDNTFPVGDIFPAEPAPLVPSRARHLVRPDGFGDVNNAEVAAGTDFAGFSFVPNATGTYHRLLADLNMEGVDTNSKGEAAPSEIRNPGGTGRSGYGNGNGGTVLYQIVPGKPGGGPDLTTVIATETINAVDRYEESKAFFASYGLDLTKPNQMLFWNVNAELEGDQVYYALFWNVHPEPAANFFSVNFPTCSIEAAGPHRLFTTDKFASGAMGGLDPREHGVWSIDSGDHVWTGEKIGGDTLAQGIDPPRAVHLKGCYSGFSELETDQKVRLPMYGWLALDGTVTPGQP
jgi:hypothetical protein